MKNRISNAISMTTTSCLTLCAAAWTSLAFSATPPANVASGPRKTATVTVPSQWGNGTEGFASDQAANAFQFKNPLLFQSAECEIHVTGEALNLFAKENVKKKIKDKELWLSCSRQKAEWRTLGEVPDAIEIRRERSKHVGIFSIQMDSGIHYSDPQQWKELNAWISSLFASETETTTEVRAWEKKGKAKDDAIAATVALVVESHEFRFNGVSKLYQPNFAIGSDLVVRLLSNQLHLGYQTSEFEVGALENETMNALSRTLADLQLPKLRHISLAQEIHDLPRNRAHILAIRQTLTELEAYQALPPVAHVIRKVRLYIDTRTTYLQDSIRQVSENCERPVDSYEDPNTFNQDFYLVSPCYKDVAFIQERIAVIQNYMARLNYKYPAQIPTLDASGCEYIEGLARAMRDLHNRIFIYNSIPEDLLSTTYMHAVTHALEQVNVLQYKTPTGADFLTEIFPEWKAKCAQRADTIDSILKDFARGDSI